MTTASFLRKAEEICDNYDYFANLSLNNPEELKHQISLIDNSDFESPKEIMAIQYNMIVKYIKKLGVSSSLLLMESVLKLINNSIGKSTVLYRITERLYIYIRNIYMHLIYQKLYEYLISGQVPTLDFFLEPAADYNNMDFLLALDIANEDFEQMALIPELEESKLDKIERAMNKITLRKVKAKQRVVEYINQFLGYDEFINQAFNLASFITDNPSVERQVNPNFLGLFLKCCDEIVKEYNDIIKLNKMISYNSAVKSRRMSEHNYTFFEE